VGRDHLQLLLRQEPDADRLLDSVAARAARCRPPGAFVTVAVAARREEVALGFVFEDGR
jgi:hypothetical protein